MRTFVTFSRPVWVGGLIIALCCLLLTNVSRHFLIPAVSYPFIRCSALLVTPLFNVYHKYRGVSYLYETSQRLLEERDSLLRELIVLKGTRDYLDESRECREFKKRYEADATLSTQIVLKQFSEQGHYYYIDAGENRGIQKDMVVVYDNCLVGRVSEVFQLYSKVLLITDKECHVAVRCVETGACGIHTGCNDTNEMLMEYVSHLDKIYEDDLVMSHGQGLVFPRGFGIGRISSYSLDGVQYRVKITPLIDLTQLTYCLVLLKY